MVKSIGFIADIASRGLRKHIEIPKSVRSLVPNGSYHVTINKIGTLE